MDARKTDDQNVSDAKIDVERLRLEKEKLSAEIKDIRDRANWENRIAKYVPAITVLIAAAAFCFGIYQFHMHLFSTVSFSSNGYCFEWRTGQNNSVSLNPRGPEHGSVTSHLDVSSGTVHQHVNANQSRL